jgi:hypothetical protein
VLRALKRRGTRPPVVAVGDGALGLWAAVRDPITFPRRHVSKALLEKETLEAAEFEALVRSGDGAGRNVA